MTATISPDGKYRYNLMREWGNDPFLPMVNFIMLNPSTADAEADDPTIRRCKDFGKRWGCGSLIVTNLFALRTPYPEQLYENEDHCIGPDNEIYVVDAAERANLIVCAWGFHGIFLDMGNKVRKNLIERGYELHHLGMTQHGQPRHPLYLRGDTKPQLW